jgi:hypothetical protein
MIDTNCLIENWHDHKYNRPLSLRLALTQHIITPIGINYLPGSAENIKTGNARTTRCALKREQIDLIWRRRFHSTHLKKGFSFNSFEKACLLRETPEEPNTEEGGLDPIWEERSRRSSFSITCILERIDNFRLERKMKLTTLHTILMIQEVSLNMW